MLNFDNRHYYDILKVGNHATRKEITASYSRLVKEHNPDGKSFQSHSLKQKAQEKFELINEAYQTLRNPIKRAEYDAFLDNPFREEEVDVDTKTKEEYCDDDETNKIIINCPKCDQRLRVLSGKSLRVTCSSCSHTFDYQDKYQEYQSKDSRETSKTQPQDTKAETPTSEKRNSTSQPYDNRKILNYLQKHWRGELSLAISFWVNFCLINIIISSLINWFTQSSPINHPVISARVIIIIVIIGLFIYTWQIVGLWRSCNRHVAVSGRAFWARTAQAVVVLCIVANLGNIASYYGIYKDVYQLGFQKDTTPAYSLTLKKNDSLIHLEGGLRFGVSKDVEALLESHPDVSGIILDCIGGRIYEGRELSKLILIYGLDTYSLKGCYSAGTVAFISGTNRFLGTGANLGFHQYSMDYENLEELMDTEKEQEEDLRIFKRKSVKKEFLEKLYDTSAEDLWYPSIDELLNAGVIHGIVNHSDLIPVEYQDSIEGINVKEIFLDMPVYRTIQKYEPKVFEQIMANMDKQLKKGATFLEMKNAIANDVNALALRLIPRSSNNTLIRFSQLFIESLKKLVEIDPILGLKYVYPEQYGSFVFSEYFSDEEIAQGNDVLNDIITDAYEKKPPQVDIEAAELQWQKIVLKLGDDVEYFDIDHKKLQNSDQYKRHCDALIRTYELILVENKKFAANVLRYMFAQDESDEGEYDGDIVDGEAHGYGTYTLDGNKYVGEFKNGNFDGQGTYILSNGDKYVGEFENNNATGGWYYWADGSMKWAYTDTQGNWKFQNEADRKLNDVTHNATAAMCSEFEWLDNPGAYEAHLIRRCNNPYFPAHLQVVSEEELLEARAIDNNDYLLAEEQLTQLVKSFEALDDYITVEEMNKLRERIDDLIAFSIGVGGRANQTAKAAGLVREALISAMREAFSNDHNVLETIEEAEELHKQYIRIYQIPVIAQMTRQRSPISGEEVIATILSESPETIAIAMSLQSEDIKQQFRQVAVGIIKRASDQGYIDNHLEEKLSALEVEVEDNMTDSSTENGLVGLNTKSLDKEVNDFTPDMQFVQQRLGEPHSIEKDSTIERWNYGTSYVEFKDGVFFRCYEPHGYGDLGRKLNIK